MKKFIIEFKWAIAYTIVFLLWMIIEKISGLHDAHIAKYPIYTNLFAIPALLVYVFALRDKKKNFYKGVMNWTQGFLSGSIMSIIITALSPFALYVTFNAITPDFFNNAISYAVERKSMTSATATEYFNFEHYVLQGTLGGLSMGIVTSAIVAYFLRTKEIKN